MSINEELHSSEQSLSIRRIGAVATAAATAAVMLLARPTSATPLPPPVDILRPVSMVSGYLEALDNIPGSLTLETERVVSANTQITKKRGDTVLTTSSSSGAPTTANGLLITSPDKTPVSGGEDAIWSESRRKDDTGLRSEGNQPSPDNTMMFQIRAALVAAGLMVPAPKAPQPGKLTAEQRAALARRVSGDRPMSDLISEDREGR